jgi:Zn-dependent peptidase ImmA (M78 family)
VIIDFLLPNVTEKFNSIVEKFGLSAPFTLADFQVICDVENIFLTRFEMSDEMTFGTYFLSLDGTQQSINLKPGLTEKVKLQTAAHEISHHFLHRDGMLSGEIETIKSLAAQTNITFKNLSTEFEADLLASLLLTYSAEVKNV